MRNKRLYISRILVSRGLTQFSFFLLIAALFLFLLWGLGLVLDYSLFEIILSYIDPGNSWRLEGNIVRSASANEQSDWYLPFVGFVGAVVFTGLLVSVFTNIVQYWVNRIREGHVKYNISDHIVIIGYDTVVPSLVKQLLSADKEEKQMIVIASRKPAAEVNNLICSKINEKDKNRIVYMHSELFSKNELLRLDTKKAQQIFIVGDRIEGNRDAENMRLMIVLSRIHKDKTLKQIPLTMWFDNETTYAAMQLNDIRNEWIEMFDVRPYSFYSDWADRLLVSGHYHKGGECLEYPALDCSGITKDTDIYVHLVIIGMNRMGVAIAKEAAHMLHFPNFDDNVSEKKPTVITFIDDHADIEMAFFKGRHPGYFEIAPTYYCDSTQQKVEFELSTVEKDKDNKNFLDVQFQFLKGRIESDQVRKWLISQAQDPKQYLTIAICLSDSTNALGASLYLPEEIYYNTDERNSVNIFVRQNSTGALVEVLQRASAKGNNKRFANLYPFGMIDNSFDLKEQDNTVAKIMNYIYDYYYKNDDIPINIPDESKLDVSWKKITISNQWSNLYLANSLTFKLRSIGYDIHSGLPLELSQGDKDRMARVEHNRWNMEKLLIGYRALREEEFKWSDKEKDEAKITRFIHHDICPYNNLQSKDQQNDKNIIEALPMVLRYMKEHDLLHCHIE